MFRFLITVATLLTAAQAGAGELTYAVSHGYTPVKQPPRYWQVDVSKKPPPKGIHPEYATGAPDGKLAGWARKKGTLILGFDCKDGIRNQKGPDLFFWHFGPGGTRVFVSTEPNAPSNWQFVGELPRTDEHIVEKAALDLGDLDKVYFVRLDKWEGGMWGKGRFVDAVGGVCGKD